MNKPNQIPEEKREQRRKQLAQVLTKKYLQWYKEGKLKPPPSK